MALLAYPTNPHIIMRTDKEEVLANFTAEGRSKKAAKEAAAKLMALSGHCVSSASVILCSNV